MEREQASKFVNDLLRLMVTRNGSDLFLTADFPPAIKVDGKVTKVSPQPLTGAHTMALPRVIKDVALTKRGLIIMVGATGSGKTTSQAAMLDWRNENTFGHIITVED